MQIMRIVQQGCNHHRQEHGKITEDKCEALVLMVKECIGKV